MPIGERLYETAVRAAVPLLRLAAPFHDKLSRGLTGRRASLASLRQWAQSARDTDRPLVWLHAPSVGEALMAQAILHELRERHPAVQSIFTYFSPSAERAAARVGADWSGYLPWDTAPAVRAALDAARPDVVAFVRSEIWPVLGRAAAERGARVVLVNAVLAEGSSRTGRLARALLGSAYARLDAAGAVSEEDAARLPRLGIPSARITVTGDARFDQVWARTRALDRGHPLLHLLRTAARTQPARPLLVAGSTWAADEERLLHALTTARAGEHIAWRMIIAPHEPTDAHVAQLEQRIAHAGLTHARLPREPFGAGTDAFSRDVLVVDRVGVLADLYAAAAAAYVGGGFGTEGLHSVVEPAALGVPVVYGPRHGSSGEAARLAHAGGGFIVTTTDELGGRLRQLEDPAARAAAGAAARAFVQAGLGGAAGSAALIGARLRASRH